jgi:hypothetical protein
LAVESDTLIQQREINHRREIASTQISRAINSGQTGVYALVGPMGADKSNTLKATLGKITADATVYKLDGDTRSGTNGSQVWVRNGTPITGDVRAVGFGSGIDRVISDLKSGQFGPGHVVTLVEAQFIAHGQEPKVEQLLELARQQELSIVADCLMSWFSSEPIAATVAFARGARSVFRMQAWDDLDPAVPADASMRLVGITRQGEIIPPHKTDALFLNGLSAQDRLQMVAALFSAGVGEKLVMNNPDGSGIDFCFGLPSHPDDPHLAIGAARYRTLSSQNFRRVYTTIGIPLAVHDLSSLADINFFDWSTVAAG